MATNKIREEEVKNKRMLVENYGVTITNKQEPTLMLLTMI